MPPGVALRIGRKGRQPDPIQTDVAGFAGRARRGPVGVPTRVEEWSGFVAVFGGFDADCPLTYAVHGYFESGGKIAVVVRTADETAAAARVRWEPDEEGGSGFARAAGLPANAFDITASSPGDWADHGRVRIDYLRDGSSRGEPVFAITVEIDGEPAEFLTGLKPADIANQVEAQSRFIRLAAADGAERSDAPARGGQTPRRVQFKTLELTGGRDGGSSAALYQDAVRRLVDEPEVALIALPGLYDDVPPNETDDLRAVVIAEVAAAQDRLLLLDPPRTEEQFAARAGGVPAGETPIGVKSLVAFADGVRTLAGPEACQSAVAVYHPWVRVEDPLGPPAQPLRTVAPSGHVAGVISRLDRERGAGVTPANAPVFDALDTDALVPRADADALYAAGINWIRPDPGRGLILWGGRALALEESNRYLAHRRFAHRLVRALRATAAPLVHEPNRPALWKLLTRGAIAVLADAHRGGVLAGETPGEAYQVTPDETVDREAGVARVEIAVALAAPMEFIKLVVTLNEDGLLEVFDP